MPRSIESRPLPPVGLNLLFLLLAVGLAGSGCGPSESEQIPDPGLGTFVDADAELSPLAWANGEVSLNDQCPVRRVRLNPRMPSIYVNGDPIGFC